MLGGTRDIAPADVTPVSSRLFVNGVRGRTDDTSPRVVCARGDLPVVPEVPARGAAGAFAPVVAWEFSMEPATTGAAGSGLICSGGLVSAKGVPAGAG